MSFSCNILCISLSHDRDTFIWTISSSSASTKINLPASIRSSSFASLSMASNPHFPMLILRQSSLRLQSKQLHTNHSFVLSVNLLYFFILSPLLIVFLASRLISLFEIFYWISNSCSKIRERQIFVLSYRGLLGRTRYQCMDASRYCSCTSLYSILI